MEEKAIYFGAVVFNSFLMNTFSEKGVLATFLSFSPLKRNKHRTMQ